MSGECSTCGEHAVDCECQERLNAPMGYKTPNIGDPVMPYTGNDYSEIFQFMRTNIDILKKELSDHVDKELARFRQGTTKKESHPWSDFLDARYRAILWMKNTDNRSDAQIAIHLSMDERQVFLIRTMPRNE